MIEKRVRNLERRWRKQIKALPLPDGIWRSSRRLRPDDPAQGWKIHVSATRLSACEVFSRVLPILREHDAFFKVIARLDLLAELNAGLSEFSQIGKILTVYSRSTSGAVQLAGKLHLATRGLRGPQIPFDARYRKNSIVYYRYGSFKPPRKASAGKITERSGKAHPDKRAPGHAVPRWLDDPFQKRSADANRANKIGSLSPDYLPFKVISRRGKGSVYEALDFTVSPARLVIIKEGRRDGETAWNGADGFARVTHEGRVLRILRAAGIPVPEIFREFNRDDNRYLVMEKIEGRALLPRDKTQPAKTSWRRAQKILEDMEPVLAKMHAAGWVWRDCKPPHIFRHRGAIRLIDFEGAVRINEAKALPWSAPDYLPRSYHKKLRRRRGAAEDNYALGVIAFQFGAGEFPPADRRRRARIFQRTHCPDLLRAKIETLLADTGK